MTKVVINVCYGGFTIEWLEERGVFNTPYLNENLKRTKDWMEQSLGNYVYDDMMLRRDNPLLVECVETLKQDAYDRRGSKLVIEERDGSLDKDFFIGNYDGYEEIFKSEKEADNYSRQL